MPSLTVTIVFYFLTNKKSSKIVLFLHFHNKHIKQAVLVFISSGLNILAKLSLKETRFQGRETALQI